MGRAGQLDGVARKPRLEWEGACYHIMARGNARARIFEGEEDYLLFVETLEEGLARFGVELHAWVLMPNHYHLAASTPRGNLSRWMAWQQTTYTARYNRRHRRVGHLFQGRYRAEVVDADGYARHLGYKDGSGVTHAVKRVERLRRSDGILDRNLGIYEGDSIFKG